MMIVGIPDFSEIPDEMLDSVVRDLMFQQACSEAFLQRALWEQRRRKDKARPRKRSGTVLQLKIPPDKPK
jgi:hypothetical protein